MCKSHLSLVVTGDASITITPNIIMVLTSDASISIWSFYASEDGLDISKPCVLLMFVLLVMTGL